MWGGTGNDADHQWRQRQAVALDGKPLIIGGGVIRLEEFGDGRSGYHPPFPLENDEPPRRQLSVVGHAGADAE